MTLSCSCYWNEIDEKEGCQKGCKREKFIPKLKGTLVP